MSARRYEARGAVRGACGHQHRDVHTAHACVRRDRRGCEGQGGYSDRVVCAIGGELTEYEEQLIEDIEDLECHA